MCTGHEVCAEQREADRVATLGRKLQTLLEHLLKCTAVETRNKVDEQFISTVFLSVCRARVLYNFVRLTRK